MITLQERQQAVLEDVKKRMETVIKGGVASQARIFDEVKKSVGILRTMDSLTAEKYLKMAWAQIKKAGESEIEYRRRVGSVGKSYEDRFTR